MKKRAVQTSRPLQGATRADAAHGAPRQGRTRRACRRAQNSAPHGRGAQKAVSGDQPPNRPVIQSQMRAKNPGSSSAGSGEGAGVTRGT